MWLAISICANVAMVFFFGFLWIENDYHRNVSKIHKDYGDQVHRSFLRMAEIAGETSQHFASYRELTDKIIKELKDENI